MDLLKKVPVPEDVVHYRLFLVHSGAHTREQTLLRLLEDLLAELTPLLAKYIWQQQPFNLSYCPEKGDVPGHLGGSTQFGDNVEDEWFIVYLLKHLTSTFTQLTATVHDNDGQFLLIEAAEHLPKWLDPDSSENRVFLYQGELHILPNRVRSGDVGCPRDSVPSLQEALDMLHKHTDHCLAEKRIRSTIDNRLQGYPDKIQASLHRAHCYVPAAIAAVLSRRPDLIAPAVSAFYLRDPIDLQACRTFRNFPPDTRVLASVTFTRCLYAQLTQQSFVPDRRSGYTLPPRSHPQFKAHELGMKLAHGFEILCSKSRRAAEGQEAPVGADPRWRGFLASLQRNGYFKGELEGSVLYKELLTSAENFFKQSVSSPHSSSVHDPGEEVLRVLESASYSLEELKKLEAHLPPEDSDDWLNITPQELERLLEERGGRGVALNGAVASEGEGGEEEAGYSLVAVTQGMKKFINAMSSHEGAEFPRTCLSQPFSFNPDAVTSAMDRLLGAEEEDLDSDDLEDEEDEDDDEDEEAESQEQAGAETLGSLRRYMDEMDQELQTTNMAKSFTHNGKQGGDTSKDAATSSEQVEEEPQPLDVDLNLVTNLLESLASQAGLAGPASNLLQSLGIHLPPNADQS